MAASNSSQAVPFLTYLTVFKARLGVVNTVLGLTDFGYMPPETLTKKLSAVFSERIPISLADSANNGILNYLIEKRLVGSERPRATGRYQDFTLTRASGKWRALSKAGEQLDAVAVYRTDVWFSDPALPSTVGVPTPDNAEEVVELSRQLAVLTRAKNTWTAGGQLIAGLRKQGTNESRIENPMVLGLEAPGLMRQVLAVDGLLIRQLLLHIVADSDSTIRRDVIALQLPAVAAKALEDARRLRRPPPEISAAKAFVELLKVTAAKRATQSGAPGVLEHRTSPRLEWLTDLGVLSKNGLARNGFEYLLTQDTEQLVSEFSKVQDSDAWPELTSLGYWRHSKWFGPLRAAHARLDLATSLVEGYRVMRRSVGPASIRDVAFAACLLCSDTTISYPEMIHQLIQWAATTDGVTVSGGRYSRGPELIHLAPKVLGE